jgi:hypothetical protein
MAGTESVKATRTRGAVVSHRLRRRVRPRGSSIWILVGNAPFLAAVLAGLALAVVINASSLLRRQPLMALEAGTAVAFAVFVIMALTLCFTVVGDLGRSR